MVRILIALFLLTYLTLQFLLESFLPSIFKLLNSNYDKKLFLLAEGFRV